MHVGNSSKSNEFRSLVHNYVQSEVEREMQVISFPVPGKLSRKVVGAPYDEKVLYFKTLSLEWVVAESSDYH